MPDRSSESEQRHDVDRLVTFSDAVFAIAMTLLVVNLRVPELTGANQGSRLWSALQDQWPEVFSYALSFYVIGRLWLVHHRNFRVVRRVDSTLLGLNLVLLALIAFMPYPTEILGRYGDTSVAVVAYSVAMTCTAAASLLVTVHLQRAGLVDDRVTDRHRAHSRLRAAGFLACFTIAIPVAFFDGTAAQVTWFVALALVGMEGRRRYGSVHRPFEE